jgi:hypothetical protein
MENGKWTENMNEMNKPLGDIEERTFKVRRSRYQTVPNLFPFKLFHAVAAK